MRILQLHHYYAERGGEDAVVDAERGALAARGHEVRLLSRSSRDLPLGGALAAVAVSRNLAAAAELEKALDEFRPDVVHAHNLFPGWGLAALEVLIKRRQKAVQTLHNFRWLCAKATLLRDGQDCRLCAEGDFWSATKYACFRDSRVLSSFYGRALAANRRGHVAERAFGRMICVSDFVKRTHESSGFGKGLLTVKGHFCQETPGSLGDDGSIVFVGRLAEEKGFAVLAEALLSLPQARVTVIGEGPERESWESRLGGRASFRGRLDHEELGLILQQARMLVAPSLGTETFALAAMEAMACAKPVVCSDAGGLPELVQDGKTGYVVPRGDARALGLKIARLLKDKALAARLGKAGLKRVKGACLEDASMAALEKIYAQA